MNLAIVFAPCTPGKYSETSPETECLEVIIISYETLRGIISLTTHAILARELKRCFSAHARKATRPLYAITRPIPHARLRCGARKHYVVRSVLRRIFWIAHNVLCMSGAAGDGRTIHTYIHFAHDIPVYVGLAQARPNYDLIALSKLTCTRSGFECCKD